MSPGATVSFPKWAKTAGKAIGAVVAFTVEDFFHANVRKVFHKKKLSERSSGRSSDSLSSEVFITMHRSYDDMGGTQVTDRPQTSPNVDQHPQSAIASGDLLQGRRQVWIDHDGTLYCLKATSNGRLYLTK